MEEKVICPKCHNPECEPDHDFCWNCGYELGNCCLNPDCYQLGMTEEDENIVPLLSHYVHCPFCGHPSRYAQDGCISQREFEI